MVKDFTNTFLGGGGGGRGMLDCVCVQGFIQDFEFWEGVSSKVQC